MRHTVYSHCGDDETVTHEIRFRDGEAYCSLSISHWQALFSSSPRLLADIGATATRAASELEQAQREAQQVAEELDAEVEAEQAQAEVETADEWHRRQVG